MPKFSVFTSNLHKDHDIVYEIFNGEKEVCPEKPCRVDNVLTKIKSFSEFLPVQIIDEDLILQVHDSDYINFLQKVSNSDQEKIYPSVWNYSNYLNLQTKNLEIQAGNYAFDTFTPFTKNIWKVALESASLAVSAAKFTLKTQRPSYALCRPPGHHATKNQSGGYCYLANASLTAQFLLNHGKNLLF
jgi:acetoin utilization deacetylase AcuC-like enzyme